MKHKSSQQAKLERENRAWRQALVEEIGHCQLPDCLGFWPRDLCCHEIACGPGRSRAFSQRLAVLVACSHCNTERLTDYSIWPPERQTALQCVLLGSVAAPQEIIDAINFCRGRSGDAITWADCAKWLTVQN
jgi:hypothetical protein